jgi:hypothetical protein
MNQFAFTLVVIEQAIKGRSTRQPLISGADIEVSINIDDEGLSGAILVGFDKGRRIWKTIIMASTKGKPAGRRSHHLASRPLGLGVSRGQIRLMLKISNINQSSLNLGAGGRRRETIQKTPNGVRPLSRPETAPIKAYTLVIGVPSNDNIFSGELGITQLSLNGFAESGVLWVLARKKEVA